MLNNPNEWHNIEEEIEGDVNEGITRDSAAKPPKFPKKNIKYIIIAIFVLVLIIVGALLVIKKRNADKTQLAADPNQMAQSFYDKASDGANGEQMAVVDVDLGDAQAEVAIPAASTAVPLSAQSSGDDLVIASKEITPTDKYNYNKAITTPISGRETVIVSVGNEGRENPFLPYKEKKMSVAGGGYSGYGNMKFDIIEPPTAILPDPKAVQLMETTISGIMFDYKNPSAIVNIDGQDQLVRKYDKLNGFTILDITRDKVVIKSGTNIYRASVGQSITTEDVTINEIPNLQHKFGGAYRKVSRNAIEIKSN